MRDRHGPGRFMLPMVAALLAGAACSPGQPQTRVYHIAADEVEWDYAPATMDVVTGHPFDSVARELT
jgi:hypothetical protein